MLSFRDTICLAAIGLVALGLGPPVMAWLAGAVAGWAGWGPRSV